ncbi:unnamed protein product [Penicillium glandicola]
METITDEQIQHVLDGIDQSTGLKLFHSFFDRSLLPGDGIVSYRLVGKGGSNKGGRSVASPGLVVDPLILPVGVLP